MKSSGLLDRRGMAGDGIIVGEKKVNRRKHIPRAAIGVTVAGLAILAIVAVLVAPAGETGATPGRTGGNCGNCHPVTSSSFLTVNGFPAQYVPGAQYTITVSIADANGLSVGENSFDLILSTGGGTIVGINQFVKNVSALQVATNQLFNTTVAQWTVKWTAPSSGSVTVDTWAVYGTGGSPSNSPYQHITTSVTAGAIPEFSLTLLPLAGAAIGLVLAFRLAKRKNNN